MARSIRSHVEESAARMRKEEKIKPGKATRMTIERHPTDGGGHMYSTEAHCEGCGEKHAYGHKMGHKTHAAMSKHVKMAFEGEKGAQLIKDPDDEGNMGPDAEDEEED